MVMTDETVFLQRLSWIGGSLRGKQDFYVASI